MEALGAAAAPASPAATGGNGGRRGKGPRPKHVPRRMCVACREHDAKRGLIRIVRTPEGAVELDPSGRRNGRGAYLCHKAACWERGLRAGILNRALNTVIDDEAVATLRRHAAILDQGVAAATEPGGETAATGGN